MGMRDHSQTQAEVELLIQGRDAATIFAVVMAWPTWRWVWSAMWTSKPATVVGNCFLPTVRGSPKRAGLICDDALCGRSESGF